MVCCCCPCSRKSRVLVVGVSDLVLGIIGFLVFGTALILKKMEDGEPDPNSWRSKWEAKGLEYYRPIYLCAFLTLTGILTISSSCFQNEFCAITAAVSRLLWALFWIGMTLITTAGALWYNGFNKDFVAATLSIVIPGGYAVTQLYFVHVLLNFRRKELKSGGTPAGGISASASFELSPI